MYVYFRIVWGSTSTRSANPRFNLPILPDAYFPIFNKSGYYCDSGIACYALNSQVVAATQSSIFGNSTNDFDFQTIWYFK